MAIDRFTKFKLLRALWARARNLLAWLAFPKSQESRHAAQRWVQIQIAERHIKDGVIRGSGDPDSAVRPVTWPAYDVQAWEPQREAAQRFQEAQQRPPPRREWEAHWQAQLQAQVRQTAQQHARNDQQPRR